MGCTKLQQRNNNGLAVPLYPLTSKVQNLNADQDDGQDHGHSFKGLDFQIILVLSESETEDQTDAYFSTTTLYAKFSMSGVYANISEMCSVQSLYMKGGRDATLNLEK